MPLHDLTAAFETLWRITFSSVVPLSESLERMASASSAPRRSRIQAEARAAPVLGEKALQINTIVECDTNGLPV